MELSIEKFSPTKAEVIALVENVKNTIVSLPAGNTGYALMRENKSLLQKKRTDLTRMFKEERAGALAYQKGIIKIEKDLVALIEPVESDLDAKIAKIDEENERAKRVKDLPERMERLKLIETEANPDELLGLNDNDFLEYFNNMKAVYLGKKELAIKVEAEKKERERLAAEQKKKEEADKIEAERQAKIKEENDKLEAERKKIKEEQDKIEAEKKRIADEALEAERKKQREIELEAAKKKAAEDEVKRINEEKTATEIAERVRKEQREKNEKYQQFLRDNQYTPDDIVKTEGNKTTLYRKVAEITL